MRPQWFPRSPPSVTAGTRLVHDQSAVWKHIGGRSVYRAPPPGSRWSGSGSVRRSSTTVMTSAASERASTRAASASASSGPGLDGPPRRYQTAAAAAARSGTASAMMARRGAIAGHDTAGRPAALGSTAVDLGLEGRTALVTGASKGIGLGIARALASEGARVAVSSRSKERIEAAAGEIGALPLVHDSSELDSAPGLVESVEEELGPLHVLVTNTGGPPAGPDPLAFSREQWEAAHRNLVLSPLALIAAALPGMRERGFGRILSVSSSAAREPIPALMLSNAHRPGLLGALKTIARQVAADGVTVNTVLPGRIATDRMLDTFGSREEAERAASEQVPAGRLGRVEELGAVAAFLCSAPAGYVTGSAVAVDGGMLHGL